MPAPHEEKVGDRTSVTAGGALEGLEERVERIDPPREERTCASGPLDGSTGRAGLDPDLSEMRAPPRDQDVLGTRKPLQQAGRHRRPDLQVLTGHHAREKESGDEGVGGIPEDEGPELGGHLEEYLDRLGRTRPLDDADEAHAIRVLFDSRPEQLHGCGRDWPLVDHSAHAASNPGSMRPPPLAIGSRSWKRHEGVAMKLSTNGVE